MTAPLGRRFARLRLPSDYSRPNLPQIVRYLLGAMAISHQFAIRGSGDFEVVLLHEAVRALSDVVSLELYDIGGPPNNEEVRFKSASTFEYWTVQVAEMIQEAAKSVEIDGRFQNHSILSALDWFCKKHPDESSQFGLQVAMETYLVWLSAEPEFEFWCGSIEKQFRFSLSRRDLLTYSGNFHKHSLLRLNQSFERLRAHLDRNGLIVSESETIYVKESFEAEVKSRLEYHASYLCEMLGDIWLSLNSLIRDRAKACGTNDVRSMVMPNGVLSSAYKDLYGATLIFLQYDDERIRSCRPQASSNLRKRF